jgi:hypothetical protein
MGMIANHPEPGLAARNPPSTAFFRSAVDPTSSKRWGKGQERAPLRAKTLCQLIGHILCPAKTTLLGKGRFIVFANLTASSIIRSTAWGLSFCRL